MKTYYVKVAEVYTTEIKVEAEDENEAREIAEECLNAGENQDGSELEDGTYDYTIDSDEWVVYQ